jgi:hypothetical protein
VGRADDLRFISIMVLVIGCAVCLSIVGYRNRYREIVSVVLADSAPRRFSRNSFLGVDTCGIINLV